MTELRMSKLVRIFDNRKVCEENESFHNSGTRGGGLEISRIMSVWMSVFACGVRNLDNVRLVNVFKTSNPTEKALRNSLH